MPEETTDVQNEVMAIEVLSIDRFMHIREPYGTLHLRDCTWTPYIAVKGCDDYTQYHADKGNGCLEGTVESGVTISRLLHITNRKDMAGKHHFIGSVSKDELAKGYKRTIAM